MINSNSEDIFIPIVVPKTPTVANHVVQCYGYWCSKCGEIEISKDKYIQFNSGEIHEIHSMTCDKCFCQIRDEKIDLIINNSNTNSI